MDTLVQVTKYCLGLDLQINVAITMFRAAPDLTNYAGWHVHTFWQYKVFTHVQTETAPSCIAPAALPQLRTMAVFPTPVFAPWTVALPAPIPPMPTVVPMDVHRIWAHTFPCTCFCSGAARHLARECPVMSNIQHTKILDDIVHQLGDDLLDELFACLSTITLLPAEFIDIEMDPMGFPSPAK
jgi:hypothetical protein